MHTSSIQVSSRISLFTGAGAPFFLSLLTGCGTALTPAVVDISGRAVEVVEAGAGEATVVFESGFGNDWSPWDQVAGVVAGRARVFAYSRPGYGQSGLSTAPRDATHIVEDLRALLAARGYEPPYVLVGHSFGGTYMELFAKKYPEEVTALVLVEPRHRDFTAACEAEGLSGCSIPASAVASLPPVEIAEYEAFAHASEEIGALGSFGSYPVRVLTTDSHGFDPIVEARWVSMLGALADEAPDGEQILFPGADHFLQVKRAQDVSDVILDVASQK